MNNKKSNFIKANRIFSPIREYAWLFTVLVAIGGQWVPKLGLLVLFVMISLMVTAFFNGRYWCGNICPHGSLFDKLLLPISRNMKIPSFLKSKVFIIAFFIFFMFNLIRRIVNAASWWGTLDFLDKVGYIFSNTYLIVLIVGGILGVVITPRTWCQFCPMGTFQKISYKLGVLTGVTKKTEKKITIEDKEKCRKCGRCSKVCPFQLNPHMEFSDNNQFDNIDCIKCATCVKNCPIGILSLKNKKEMVFK
ncbi:MAG TPA: 4Fe-4S binding protein [Clostridiaceae bacterium]|nr:4Fe-4S binding protein [Clostridiaceae bacterium]